MLENFIVEIVGGVLSSFLGFFLAIYLQRKTDRENEEKRVTVIIKSISEELSDISVSLKQYIQKNKAIDRNILTPNLDALMNSGMIIELIEKDIYTYVIDAFSMIKRLNDEPHYTSVEERLMFMNEIVNCSDNVIFLTKKLKERVD
jgi:hypothetical protein